MDASKAKRIREVVGGGVSDPDAKLVAEAMAEEYPASSFGVVGLLLLRLCQAVERIEAKLENLSEENG